MLVKTLHLGSLTTAFLGKVFDYISPAVDNGSIIVNSTAGRDNRPGLVFATADNSNTFEYGLYEQATIPASDTQIFGMAINWSTQHTLGGRLLTLVDGDQSIFGETTQVGINLMPDGTLKAVRANAQGTGVILRGLDQSGDAQVTLLGQSAAALNPGQADYLEIRVVHHPTAGSITANFYENHVLIDTWSLTNLNTAISGRNQSTSFCLGGYSSVGVSDNTRHHEDLQGTISDFYCLNNLVNPSDSRDPVFFIGDRAGIVKVQTSNVESDWTPNPVVSNYQNVDEIPPDDETTENTTDTITDKDLGAMQAAGTASSDEVYLAYTAYVKSDSDGSCVSGDPALFEAFVWTEETDPGEVHTSANDTSPCTLTDFISRRAQSVCTISENGESVVFKPGPAPSVDAYYVGLSPLDAPPRLQVPTDPSYYSMAIWSFGGVGDPKGVNTEQVAGATRYLLPWYQPWLGYSVDTEDQLDTAGDFFEFKLLNNGIGIDVGLMDNQQSNIFNPYTSPLTAFHFRVDSGNGPYFWIGPSFSYDGQTVYTYSATDNFKLVRNDPNIQVYQNGVLLETIAVTMPLNVSAFAFMGRWGYDTLTNSYSLRPGIKQAFVQIGGSNCVTAHYVYAMLSTSWDIIFPPEMQQWGIQFIDSFAEGLIFDPGATHGPFPLFGYDADTTVTFVLSGGNVVVEIRDYVYLDLITDVGGVGVYTYTIPFANTDDFVQSPPITVGPPSFPSSTLEYDFPTPGANAPLRLVTVFGGDNGGVERSISDVEFTFNPGAGPANYAGVMRKSSTDKQGSAAAVPTPDYRYAQSFLASTPQDAEITINDYEASAHGYEYES